MLVSQAVVWELRNRFRGSGGRRIASAVVVSDQSISQSQIEPRDTAGVNMKRDAVWIPQMPQEHADCAEAPRNLVEVFQHMQLPVVVVRQVHHVGREKAAVGGLREESDTAQPLRRCSNTKALRHVERDLAASQANATCLQMKVCGSAEGTFAAGIWRCP